MLTIFEQIPDSLLSQPAERLHEILPGPSLIHLNGRHASPLFVAVLLHGDEVGGWEALRSLLHAAQKKTLPRALMCFIGDVAAARKKQRRIEGKADYDQIWSKGTLPEHKMARQVLDIIKKQSIFACVGIHNSVGVNPHFSRICQLGDNELHLARLYSRTIVYTKRRDKRSLNGACSALCPAIAVEAGRPNDKTSTLQVQEYIKSCLQLDHMPEHPLAPVDVDLFHVIASVRVPSRLSFDFSRGAFDIRFSPDLERLNFCELPANTVIGWTRPGERITLDVIDAQGKKAWNRFFIRKGDEIRTRRALIPSMLTKNTEIIRQDGLCHLMERRALG